MDFIKFILIRSQFLVFLVIFTSSILFLSVSNNQAFSFVAFGKTSLFYLAFEKYFPWEGLVVLKRTVVVSSGDSRLSPHRFDVQVGCPWA